MPKPKMRLSSRPQTIGICYLDEFANKALTNKGIYPLTENNRNIVETSLACNRAYKSNLSILVKNLTASYKTNEMKDVLKEINKTNSTRLSDAELDVITDRILKRYSNLNDLKKELNCGQSGADRLLNLVGDKITTPVKGSNKTRSASHPSFASKVIFYLSEQLGCTAHLSFPKYDSIVASKLSSLLDEYGINKNHYTDKDFELKHPVNINVFWNMYINKYMPSLIDLLNEAKNVHGYSLSSEEMDRIIWYL